MCSDVAEICSSVSAPETGPWFSTSSLALEESQLCERDLGGLCLLSHGVTCPPRACRGPCEQLRRFFFVTDVLRMVRGEIGVLKPMAHFTLLSFPQVAGPASTPGKSLTLDQAISSVVLRLFNISLHL